MNKLIFQIEDQITEMRLAGLVPKTISMCPVVLKALSEYLRPILQGSFYRPKKK